MHVQGRLHAFHNHSSTCEAAHPIRHIPGPVRRAGRSMADRPWVGHRRVVSTDVWTFRVSSGVLDSGACIDVMSPLFLFRIKQYNRYVRPMWRRADPMECWCWSVVPVRGIPYHRTAVHVYDDVVSIDPAQPRRRPVQMAAFR